MQAIREALDALTAFLQPQGADLASSVTDDTTNILRMEMPAPHPVDALSQAQGLLRHDAKVAIIVRRDEVESTLRLHTDGWESDGILVEVLPDLSSLEEPDRWTTAQLAGPLGERDDVDVRCAVELDKRRWTVGIQAQTGRSVWIGPFVHGFRRWLTETKPMVVSTSLFAREGALVLLGDWDDPPVHLGEVFVLGALETEVPAPAQASTGWPVPTEEALLHTLTVDLDGAADTELKRALAPVLAWAAARLLAEEIDGDTMRPHRGSTTRWAAGSHTPSSPSGCEAVRDLCRWVREEPTESRLAVARRVAADKIADPLDGPSAEEVVEAAAISYRVVVDETVRSGLSAQAELEANFKAFDSELGVVLSSLVSSLDAVLLRAFAGVVAILVASQAVESSYAVLVWLLGALVIAYVALVATVELGMTRRDARARLKALESVVRSRPLGLDERPLSALEKWRRRLECRVRWLRGGLAALIVVILVVTAIVAVTA